MPVAVDTSGVLAGKTITAVTAGGAQTCALADGMAYCWGLNDFGQLGNNSRTESTAPVAVDTSGVLAGKTITAVTAGGVHTCAVADGRAYCWGNNQVGQLGNNTLWDSPLPVVVDASGAMAGTVVTAIDAGGMYTASLATDIPAAPVTPTVATPGKVTGVKAVVKKGKVKLTWKAVAGATSYRARISKPGGKKYKAWKTTTKRVFKTQVKKGKKYRFQVRAVNAAGRGPVTTVRFKGK